MILYLTHGNGEESIPLKLPASSSQVEEIDIRLDDICSGEGNFRISDAKSSVKGLWQFIRSADLLDPEDLEKLNRLSRQLDAMSEKERQIFAGALLSECISNLDDVLQTVGRIGQYEIITGVTCDRELGGYLVEHGKIDCPEYLKPYLDYVGIGAEFYSNYGGAYTLDGYVVRKEHLPNYSQAPEPWRNENRDEMLRMTLRVDGKPDYQAGYPHLQGDGCQQGQRDRPQRSCGLRREYAHALHLRPQPAGSTLVRYRCGSMMFSLLPKMFCSTSSPYL